MVDELPEGVSRDRVKVELQVPLTPIVTKTPKSSKKIGEKSGATAGVRLDFTETVRREKITLLAESKQEEEPASGRPYLYLSDAHVEAMILYLVGPSDLEASTAFMRSIKLSKEGLLYDITVA